MELLDLLRPELATPTCCNFSLSPDVQLLAAEQERIRELHRGRGRRLRPQQDLGVT